ncbi:phosphoglycerate kinase [Candidatus Phycosocius bacilliformis]|uniref:Phosphoglycerate kinase n=1 Tax=Candidatus Phycosocius bacilliformis TaxID=1445552 RepID=A0A2P2E6F2_9PROT|nr:phosphoglycerate kinase [Candidatus Phycosocius bacilliformis]GBF56643.1 phosphoglycerate kinase [Candidatus Phycosocius bacilliformis]
MSFSSLKTAALAGKRAFVRVDFNVPVQDGVITDDTRLRAAIPTIELLVSNGAKVILAAHFDRPKGKVVPAMSLARVAPALSALLGKPVGFAADCVGPVAETAVAALQDGDILLLENTRFHPGEEANDPELAKGFAKLADLYVNDAFSAAHRAHASTEGIAHLLPSYPGLSMAHELDYLDKALGNPTHPVMAVVGGAKVSSKIDLLKNLVGRVDMLAVGGGMANTFLAARGAHVGKSLCEHDLLDIARAILAEAEANACQILLPTDVVVAEAFAAHAPHRTCEIADIKDHEMILDAGPKSVAALAAALETAKTLVWNGPLGAFELSPFDVGTMEAARTAAGLARSGRLIAVAGGGDTVSALNQARVAGDFTFVSTAGGAFLEWMEGKALPGVEALKTQN